MRLLRRRRPPAPAVRPPWQRLPDGHTVNRHGRPLVPGLPGWADLVRPEPADEPTQTLPTVRRPLMTPAALWRARQRSRR